MFHAAVSRGFHLVTHAWQPVLDGDDAARARSAIADIADAIARAPEPARSPEHGDDAELAARRAVSLSDGAAGFAVLHCYQHEVTGDERAAERAVAAIEVAIDALADVRMDSDLFGGFPGIAWAAQYVVPRLFEPDDDFNAEIDDAIETQLASYPWPGDYDLVRGVGGLGVYALARLPRAAARRSLHRIVELLDDWAQRDGDRVTWLTPPAVLAPWQARAHPRGRYDLGMAHGVAGAIALLAALANAGVDEDRARSLASGAARWLLAQELAGTAGATLPDWFGPDGDDRQPARSAWCYGDPGAAVALLAAARATGDAAWERRALAMARAASVRAPADAGVLDAGLCHGAAGLGHIYNRLYQATGDAALGEAARTWLLRALDLRRAEGVAGFPACLRNPDGSRRWVDDPGLVTGATGVGLALLAAISDREPTWDRMLLLSARASSSAAACR